MGRVHAAAMLGLAPTHVEFCVSICSGAREMSLEFIAPLSSKAAIYLADSNEYLADMRTVQILTAEGVGWLASGCDRRC